MQDLSKKPAENRLYVGGLPVRSTREEIFNFFSQYGKVLHCKAKKNPKTGRLLGHVFVTFEDPAVVQKLINTKVIYEDRQCQCKPVLKDDMLKEAREIEKKKRILVYEIDTKSTNEELMEAFEGYEGFSHGFILKDPHADINRGHGFVYFDSHEAVDNFCDLNPSILVGGKPIEYSKDLVAPPKIPKPKNKRPRKQKKDTEQKHSSRESSILKKYPYPQHIDTKLLKNKPSFQPNRPRLEGSEPSKAQIWLEGLPKLNQILAQTQKVDQRTENYRLNPGNNFPRPLVNVYCTRVLTYRYSTAALRRQHID